MNLGKELRLVFWEISQACNLECEHCRASAQSVSSPLELDTDKAKRIISQIASFSNPILVFSGGEPLLREDIYELIQYANAAGLRTAVATNATLITKEVASRLKQSAVAMAAISVYGPDAVSHDRFCGNDGAFEKTLEGLKNLKEVGIPFQINTTITQKNLFLVDDIGHFALKQGAVAYHVFFLVPTGRGKQIEGDEISPEEYEEAFNHLYDLQVNLPIRIKATCAPHYYRVLRQRNALKKEEKHFKPDNFHTITKGCLVGQGVCFISYKGEVFGCGYLPIAAGDLKTEDMKKIWCESELFNILRDDSKLEGKCGVCEYKKVCSGCRARAYAATGNYLEEEPCCNYQPLTAKF